jgi:hypothetical protein
MQKQYPNSEFSRAELNDVLALFDSIDASGEAEQHLQDVLEAWTQRQFVLVVVTSVGDSRNRDWTARRVPGPRSGSYAFKLFVTYVRGGAWRGHWEGMERKKGVAQRP